MFLNNCAVALAIVASLVRDASAQQDQSPMAAQYQTQLGHGVNFTELFASDPLSPYSSEKPQNAWNGITTFAKATPLRCFGADSGVGYDVAVLGECPHNVHTRNGVQRQFLSGAPFDTATSFRPGYAVHRSLVKLKSML